MKHKTTIGVDVGGTKMTSVLFSKGRVMADFTLATPKDNLEHFLIMLKALIDPLIEKAQKEKLKIGGIGIGIPGVVDERKEIVVKCRNLPILNNVRLPDTLKEKFGLAVKIDNDANCFLRGEKNFGAGKKYNNALGITLGTGIGGAWWFNGDIYSGPHGGGFEPGRMIIDFKEPIDLEEAYHKLTLNNPLQLAEEAHRGDVFARKAFEEFGLVLGLGLVDIVTIIYPEIIVIGGSVVESEDLFMEKIKKTAKKYIVDPRAAKVKIIKGKLGPLAGAIGASLL